MDVTLLNQLGTFVQAVGFPIAVLVFVFMIYLDFRKYIFAAIEAHIALAHAITEIKVVAVKPDTTLVVK